MFDNLYFCLQATAPIFFMMVLGYFFRKVGIFKEQMTKGINGFVFTVALPVLVYKELATSDIKEIWDGRFILFCFLATLLSIAIAYSISVFFKGSSKAEFTQGAYRSSAALLGVGIAINLFGDAGMVPLMIIGAVPIYNVTAVFLLSLEGVEQKLDIGVLKKTILGVLTNPIIIAIALGLIRALIPHDLILPKTIGYVSGLATPLGLMALGASFDLKAALRQSGATLMAVFLKLVGFCALLLPLAVFYGYRKDALVAVLIMAGSPTTVSSFVMSKNMGKDGNLSASIVMLTTLLSAFTLTVWLYILKCMALI